MQVLGGGEVRVVVSEGHAGAISSCPADDEDVPYFYWRHRSRGQLELVFGIETLGIELN